MKYESLTGGQAVGAALVVWLTHGGEWPVESIAAMAVGTGAAITYIAGWVERIASRYAPKGETS